MSSSLNSPQRSPDYFMDEDKHSDVEVASRTSGNRARGGSIYRSISWMLGFKETYSLLNCQDDLAPPSPTLTL